jgi:hypothetical protein
VHKPPALPPKSSSSPSNPTSTSKPSTATPRNPIAPATTNPGLTDDLFLDQGPAAPKRGVPKLTPDDHPSFAEDDDV